MLHRLRVDLKAVCMRSWADAHLPGRHAGVGPQHRSSVELHRNDGCLQKNEPKSFGCRSFPEDPRLLAHLKACLILKCLSLTPVVTSSDNSSAPGSSSIVTHGCAPEPASQTAHGGSGADSRSKPKALLPTSAGVPSVKFLKGPGFIKSVRQTAS